MSFYQISNSQFLVLFLSTVFLLFPTNDAYAYFDPASGSSIIQIIVGVILAAAMTVKVWLRRTRRLFRKIFGIKKDSEEGTDTDSSSESNQPKST